MLAATVTATVTSPCLRPVQAAAEQHPSHLALEHVDLDTQLTGPGLPA